MQTDYIAIEAKTATLLSEHLLFPSLEPFASGGGMAQYATSLKMGMEPFWAQPLKEEEDVCLLTALFFLDLSENEWEE